MKTTTVTIILLTIAASCISAFGQSNQNTTLKDILPAGKYLILRASFQKDDIASKSFSTPTSLPVEIIYKDGIGYIHFPNPKLGEARIYYKNSGIMITIPPSEGPDYAFSSIVYSGIRSRSDKPGYFKGRVWSIPGWADYREPDVFSLEPAQ